jgi:hypothetical protein
VRTMVLLYSPNPAAFAGLPPCVCWPSKSAGKSRLAFGRRSAILFAEFGGEPAVWRTAPRVHGWRTIAQSRLIPFFLCVLRWRLLPCGSCLYRKIPRRWARPALRLDRGRAWSVEVLFSPVRRSGPEKGWSGRQICHFHNPFVWCRGGRPGGCPPPVAGSVSGACNVVRVRRLAGRVVPGEFLVRVPCRTAPTQG